MSTSYRRVSIPVICTSPDGDRREPLELNVADVVPLRAGEDRESVMLNSIEALAGLERQVMSDLFRALVLGNYTCFDGQRGKSAGPALNRRYPDQGTLPDFELKSGAFNATGMIAYNLFRNPEHDKEAYRILGGILLAMIDDESFGTPQLGNC